MRNWVSGRTRSRLHWQTCAVCGEQRHVFEKLPAEEYAYLLGLYLGDGHLARHRRNVFRLTITLDIRHVEIAESCARAMETVLPRQTALLYRRPHRGTCVVSMYSKRWPCLFPQHGPGPKHARDITLADWQRVIVAREPQQLLRGLVHSDGCRVINRVHRRGKTYEYPRYQFTNWSADIRRIFCDACDAIGVDWRRMNATNISVAKREAVARLDEFIGPKR